MDTTKLVYIPKAVRMASNYPTSPRFQDQNRKWHRKRVPDGPNKGLLYGAYEFLPVLEAKHVLGAKNIRSKRDEDGDILHLVADWPQHYFAKA